MGIVSIHPKDPQPRLIANVCDIVLAGGVIVYPTDAAYAIGCLPGLKEPLEKIQRLRQLEAQHPMTLMCRDLSEIATYAHVENWAYRFLKMYIPGPYTFILPATRAVPKRLLHPKRKAIGIRVPKHPLLQALLTALQQPLVSTSLILPPDEYPLTDLLTMEERCGSLVDVIIDGGAGNIETSTVFDLLGQEPLLVREGLGKV